jgi:ketosteroid isomerase-like protein
MSEENVEIVVSQFEGVNARDFAAVMDRYADDVVLALHGDLAGLFGEGAVGKEAVGEWFGDWFRTFDDDYRFEIEEARAFGDRVFIVATHHGRGRVSGVPVTQRMAYVYTVRKGKVSRVEVWNDREAALEAAGLRE